jgi:hypothetical protein
VTGIGELGSTLAVTTTKRRLLRNTKWNDKFLMKINGKCGYGWRSLNLMYYIINIILAVQPFVGPWPRYQLPYPAHRR